MTAENGDSRKTATPQCPHSDGKEAPVCWDCTEAGHPGSPLVDPFGDDSPLVGHQEGPDRVSRSDADRSPLGTTCKPAGNFSTLEVRPPEQGIEVVNWRDRRATQPGLEVITGPEIIHGGTDRPEILAEEKEKIVTTAKSGAVYSIQKKKLWLIIGVVLLSLSALGIGIAVGKTQIAKNQQKAPVAEPTSSAIASANEISGMGPTSSATTFTQTGTSKEPVSETIQQTQQTPPPSPGPTTSIGSKLQPSPTSTNRFPTDAAAMSPCPAADFKIYAVGNTGIRFRRHCGTAFVGGDLENGNYTTETMLDCINTCAGFEDCNAVSWSNAGPQGTANNYCFLKSTAELNSTKGQYAQSASRLGVD